MIFVFIGFLFGIIDDSYAVRAVWRGAKMKHTEV